jgi:hypothetical protein
MGIITSDNLHIELGKGILGWPPSERDSQRYGIVTLWTEEMSKLHINYKPQKRLIVNVIKDKVRNRSIFGDLIATVIGERPITIGKDPIGGFKPRPITIGNQVKLGRGILVFPDNKSICIKPIDDRDIRWMRPKQLFRVVDQLVMLSFIPNPTDGEERDKEDINFTN